MHQVLAGVYWLLIGIHSSSFIGAFMGLILRLALEGLGFDTVFFCCCGPDDTIVADHRSITYVNDVQCACSSRICAPGRHIVGVPSQKTCPFCGRLLAEVVTGIPNNALARGPLLLHF